MDVLLCASLTLKSNIIAPSHISAEIFGGIDQTMSLSDILKKVDILAIAKNLGVSLDSNNKALCVFHQEKTPSLQFYPRTNSFFCFACGEAGNVFDLVKKQRNCNFKEAVQYVCTYAGISYSVHIAKETENSTASSGLDLAQKIYAGNALHAQDEFNAWCESRSFCAQEMLEWNALHIDGSEISSRKELSVSQWEGLHTSGMIYQKNLPTNSHQLYLNLGYIPQDFFFKPSILIPIKDANDTLRGFVCRKIDTDSKYPKYKYNQYFKKSANLFGANKVQKRISEFINSKLSNGLVFDIFIVEGILDAIRLNSLDFNALALMGTNLSVANSTEESAQGNQFEILKSFAKKLSQNIVKFHIFLDNDMPGLKGAQKIAPQMLRLCKQCDNVFFDYVVIASHNMGKDPDEILKNSSKQHALDIITRNTISPADFLIACGLKFFENELFDYSQLQSLWENTPYYNKHDILRNIRKQLSEISSYNHELLINAGINTQVAKEYAPFAIQQLIGMLRGQIVTTNTPSYYSNQTSIPWLDIIEKARVSYADSDFPVDYVSWYRMKQGGPILRHFLEKQLQQKQPIEPFVLSFARRKEGEFPRVLSLPSPEDLVIETAFLSDIMNYGISNSGKVPIVFDDGRGPVTYYRGMTEYRTVSFAYQFNCQSESTDGIYESQGLFKHFSECWGDYNQYLMDCANAYPFDKKELCCIRLDIHRYYDSIPRNSVKKLLDSIFSDDLLDNDKLFAIKQISHDHADRRRTTIVQWVCNKCYEYSYYSPATGAPTSKDNNQVGIPQGPNLSAWLANILLFELDYNVMECCDKINAKYREEWGLDSEKIVSWYARYVDDMVIVAPTKSEAEEIKRVIQRELSKLGLNLSEKIDDDEVGSLAAYRELIKQNRGIISDPYGNVEQFTDCFNETAFSWAVLANYLDRKNLLTYIHSWNAIIESQNNPEKLKQKLIDAVNSSTEIRYRDYRKIVILIMHSCLNDDAIDSTGFCQYIENFFIGIHYKADTNTPVDETNFLQINHVWPFFVICEAMQLLLVSSYDCKVLLPINCKEKLIQNQKKLAQLILAQDLIPQISQLFFRDDGMYGLRHNCKRWKFALLANATLRDSSPNLSRDSSSIPSYSLFRYALSLNDITNKMSIEELDSYQNRAIVFQFHDLIHRLHKNIPAPLDDFSELKKHLCFRILCEKGAPESNAGDIDYSQIYFDAINVIARTVEPNEHFNILRNRDYLLCHLVSQDNTGINIRLLPSPDDGCTKHIIALKTDACNAKEMFVILPASQEKLTPNVYPNIKLILHSRNDCCLDIYESTLPDDILLPEKKDFKDEPIQQLEQFQNVFQSLRDYPLDDAIISAAHVLQKGSNFYPIYFNDATPFFNGLLLSGELRKYSSVFASIYKRGCVALEFAELNIPTRPKDIVEKVHDTPIDFEKSDWMENYLIWYSKNLFSGNFSQHSLPQLEKRIQQFFVFFEKLKQKTLSDADKIIQYFSSRLDHLLWTAKVHIEKNDSRPDQNGSMLASISTIASTFIKDDPAFIKYIGRVFDSHDRYSHDALTISRKDVSAWYLLGELVGKITEKQEKCPAYVNVLPAVFKVQAALSHLKSLCFDLKKIKSRSSYMSEIIANGKISSIESLSQWGLEQTKWHRDDRNDATISAERIIALFNEFKKTDRITHSIYPAGFFIIAYLFFKNTYVKDDEGQEIQFSFAEDNFFKIVGYSLDNWTNLALNNDDQTLNLLASDSDKLREVLTNYERTLGITSKFNQGFDPCNQRFNISQTIYNSSIIYDRNDLVIANIGHGHYVESVNGEYFWSETWHEDIFLSIAIISQPLADYIEILHHDRATDASIISPARPSEITNNAFPAPSNDNSSKDEFDGSTSEQTDDVYKENPNNLCDDLYRAQENLWRARKERNTRKTRVAFCQFDIGHSSYFHLDTRDDNEKTEEAEAPNHIAEDKKEEKRKNVLSIKLDYSVTSKDYESEKNHMIKILEKTIDICNYFSVDMLLLPEYSITMEILNWIIQRLVDTKSELKIWAGTLRNPCDQANSNISNLHESLSKITEPHLALLCVVDKTGLLYYRGKKYPAVALQEDFCPHNDIIKPLWESDKSGPGKFVLELICSEIFMATSPANILALAASREKLYNKYLSPKTAAMPSFKEDVINDLIEFSKNVGFVSDKVVAQPNKPIKFDDIARRTILFIPACTTRATDFHILGQSNVLAVGLCSVFNNAVSKILHTGGESCFIGFGSTTKENRVMPDTPYGGFMPGVLYPPYGKPLDKAEEALVIADIDPYYMNEGKPRQQHLPPPIELVAHIPFLDVKGADFILQKVLNELNNGQPNSHIADEYQTVRNKTKEILCDIRKHYNLALGSSIELRERYLIHEKYHTAAALMPAALYDFCFLSKN